MDYLVARRLVFGGGGMCVFVRPGFSSGIRGSRGGEEDIIRAGEEDGFSFAGTLGEPG